MFDAIKKLLENTAPVLATALGGPLAGVAVSTIENVLGINKSTSEELTTALMNATPDQVLAIKKADQDFQISVSTIASKNFGLEVKDTMDARKREVDLSNSKWGWLSLGIQDLGAFIIIIIMVIMTGWGLFYPTSNIEAQSQIINSNYNIILLLVGYWWGKSKSESK